MRYIKNIISYAGHKYHIEPHKGEVLPNTLSKIDKNITDYYEPFCGVGVIGFNVLYNKEQFPYLKRIHFSDKNRFAIDFFNLLKSEPGFIIDQWASILKEKFIDLDYFNELKKHFNSHLFDKDACIYYMILIQYGYGNMSIFNKEYKFINGFNGNRTVRTEKTQEKQIVEFSKRFDEYHQLINDSEIEVTFEHKSFENQIKTIKNENFNCILMDPPYIGSNVDYSQNESLFELHKDIYNFMLNNCSDYNMIAFNYLSANDLNNQLIHLRKCKATIFRADLTNYNFQIQQNRDKQISLEVIIYNIMQKNTRWSD